MDEFIQTDVRLVIGVARTEAKDIPRYEHWEASQRYRHVNIDIGQPESIGILQKLAVDLPSEPLLVIYNAACLTQDVHEDRSIDFDLLHEVNRVGVNGFSHTIQAFEPHFFKYGGILVGISSINAFKPPVLEPRVAYGATKAYLAMAMRCLRFAWPEKIQLVTIHLGHVGNQQRDAHRVFYPTYAMTAHKIIRILARAKIPQEIIYPLWYAIPYKFLLPFLPDSLYFKMLRAVINIGSPEKKW